MSKKRRVLAARPKLADLVEHDGNFGERERDVIRTARKEEFDYYSGPHYEDLEEKGNISFEELDDEKKENLIKKMNGPLRDLMTKRMAADSVDSLQLIYSEIHSHYDIKIPEVTPGDYNIFHDMDEKHQKVLMRLPKYNSFENYIGPLKFQYTQTNRSILFKLGAFFECMKKVLRVDCFQLQFRNQNLFAVFELDEKSIFFLSVVFSYKETTKINNNSNSHSNSNSNLILWGERLASGIQLDEKKMKEKENIEKLKTTMLYFFYFKCGCGEKIKN